ncbi:undecaprenyl-phosphate glucose phosphotransferase [Hahella chejuensis]|nr:undecaprenyl-phosphate glucose phosphotransferase [Hahella chejuensis]
MDNLQRSMKIGFGRNNLHQFCEALLDPLALFISILLVSYLFEGAIEAPSMISALFAFCVAFPGQSRLHQPLSRCLINILLGWFVIAFLILSLGYATRSIDLFSLTTILHWLWIGPAMQVSAHLAFRYFTVLLQLRGDRQKVVIVGMNEQGLELAKRLCRSPYYNVEILGFFDDRTADRLPKGADWPVLGDFSELYGYCKAQRVNSIYLSLPMTTQPRILAILDNLGDTTASVLFIPDMFVTKLIQGNVHQVTGMPVVSVCDTPFRGVNGLIKRWSDIVLSTLILLMIAPLLAVIAGMVKVSSPGPIIFKQRRYGLDGEEIIVYKFRSMTVCEDGDVIKQAQNGDKRLTPIGGFLRKTSLDELPQFINVLQGRMSIVGPRPHAVAHNEQYRKLIKGYMVRHKVRPGITGWAQVNGLRGETQTLERMQARIEFDLDYLRNWSLALDLKIILMTVGMVYKDEYAY